MSVSLCACVCVCVSDLAHMMGDFEKGVSLCHYASVSLCLCIAVSLCLYVFVRACVCVSDTHRVGTIDW